MNRTRATVGAIAATLVCYVAVAAMMSTIEVPADAPSAQGPWIRPFRVLAAMGFGIASVAHLPHLVGQLLAAVILGCVLGAIFATVRHWLQ